MNSSVQLTIWPGFLSCIKSRAGPEGEIFGKKVAVQELWREEGTKPPCVFYFLAIFSTLTYQEPQKTISGPALDIEAWNGGICSCFSAKAWTKVDAESRKT